jgi:hypothetical protein
MHIAMEVSDDPRVALARRRAGTEWAQFGGIIVFAIVVALLILALTRHIVAFE